MCIYYYIYIIFSSLELFWNPFGMVNLLQRIVCNKKKSLKHLKYTNICFHFSIHDSLHMDVSYGLLETWDINQTQNIKAENKDSVFSLKRSQVDTAAMPVTLLWALSFIYFRKIGTFRHLWIENISAAFPGSYAKFYYVSTECWPLHQLNVMESNWWSVERGEHVLRACTGILRYFCFVL